MPLVAHQGGTVVVECQSELERLLQASAPTCRIVSAGQTLPPFDVHCPLLSLAWVFGSTPASLPAATVPYVRPEAADVEAWRKVLGDDCGMMKVGLVWAGSPAHKDDRNRSLTLAALAPLGVVPDVRFFSLQKGNAAAQTEAPAGMEIVDSSGGLKDLADTAALIANLDLIIAVDTAVAHLAGAMGKPVWTLLPYVSDWRWLLDREDTPWYPTMRLFRQTCRGDWDGALVRVTEELRLAASRKKGQG